jgi:glyoxylase-like metal-dependent hydrolase (beta-lactamase superfamily II)/ferredoxin
MARLDERLAENAAGDFYVDRSCIDCETCRQIAPAVFARDGAAGQSVVRAQPRAAPERMRALMALVACPTSSIGSLDRHDTRQAAHAFPERVDDAWTERGLAPRGVHRGRVREPSQGSRLIDVYYCGYAAESSYGASSWLVRRAGGNVLVDSPRAARPLLDGIRALGGVRFMFLTHRDDVADHARFRRAFGCERILHAADVGAGTRDVERPLTGSDPVRLADDLVAIPVPGHTRGSTALLFADRVLFTGDHLWGDEDTGRLAMGRSVCWYSWPEQVRSLRRLLDFSFELVLPGHGRPFRAASAASMRVEIEALLARS